MRSKFIYFLSALVLPGVLALADHCTYEVDDYTLHLYHFDGNASDAATANPIDMNLANGADVSEYSDYIGFGQMLSTYSSSSSIAYADEDLSVSNFTGSDGAFTFEALIKFNPDATRPSIIQIVTAEGDASTDRGWQWRINSSNQLEFINLSNLTSYAASLPTSGDNAIAYGVWFHTAVTYNGEANTADNLKLYWTRLENSLTPNLLDSFTMTSDVTPSTDTVDFSIGNENRSVGGSTDNMPGWIDEVRISSIARDTSDMIFQCDLDIVEVLAQPQDIAIKTEASGAIQMTLQTGSTPVIAWYKSYDDGDIEISDSETITSSVTTVDDTYVATLEFTDANFENSGKYYAIMTNDTGIYIASDEVSVNVLGEIAYWPLGSSQYTDGYYLEAVNDYHALVYNSPVFGTGVDSQPESASVMAASQGQAVTGEMSVIPDTGSFTISMWANCTDNSFSAGMVSVSIGTLELESSSLIDNNKWHHIAITAANDIVNVYVDTILVAQGNWSLPEFYTGFMTMGGFDDASALNGLLDEVKVFNYALGVDDISTLYSEYQTIAGKSYDISDLERFLGSWMDCGRYPESDCNN